MPPKRTTAQSTKQVNYTTATAAATTSTLISKRMDNERDNDDGSRRRLHQQQQQQTNNERKTVTLKKRKVDRHHVCDDEGNEDGEMIDVDGVGIGVGMNEVDENEMMMVMTNKKNNDDGGVNAGDGNNNNSNSHSGEVMAATKPVELHDDGDNDADVNVVKELGKNEEEGHYLNNDDGYHDDVAYGRVIVVDNVVDENGDDEDEDMEEMDRAYRLHQVLSEMTKNAEARRKSIRNKVDLGYNQSINEILSRRGKELDEMEGKMKTRQQTYLDQLAALQSRKKTLQNKLLALNKEWEEARNVFAGKYVECVKGRS